MRRSRVLAVLLAPALVLALGVLRAAPAGQSNQPRPQQAPEKPVFRSGVNLVQVDAVVLDAANRPVADLEQRDFRVLENGKPQEIVSFARVVLPVPPPRPPAMTDVATNAGAEEGRLVFLLLDDVNGLETRTEAVKQAARRLVERLLPQDQVGLLWISLKKQGAREFTTDHAAILRAIDGFEAGQSRIERRMGPGERLGLPERAEGMSDPSWDLSTLGVKGVFDADRPYLAVQDVSKYLAAVAGRRKVLVYIGQGAISIAGTMTGDGLDTPRPRSHGFAALPLERAIASARDANVTVYSIDPSGRPAPGREWLDAPEGPRAPDFYLRLTRETGGISSFRSDVIKAADRVLDSMRVYYLLGYYAEPAGKREKTCKIDVRTTRSGVRILARKDYRPEPAPGDMKTRDEAALAVGGLLPVADLGLRAFAAPFRTAGRKEQAIAVAVEVAVPQLDAAAAAAAPRFTEQADLVLAAVEPGVKVRGTERVRARMSLGRARGPLLPGDRYLVCARINVRPGEYQLRIGVRSAAAARAGSVYVNVTVPDFAREPLSLSGLAIGQETTPARPSMPVARAKVIASLLPFTPVLAREFDRGEEAWAYAKVYRRKGAAAAVALTSTITNVGTGEVAWTSGEQRAAAAFRPRDEAEYRVALPLDELRPGSYRLRVEAGCADDGSSVHRELEFRVIETPRAG